VASALEEQLDEEKIPDVQAALVMTNEKCEVDADNAPAPTLEVKKLKDFIRKTAKSKPISLDLVKEIQSSLAGD
jgi:hypothetical protein